MLTAVNLLGVAESARVLMLPTVLFIVSMLGIVVIGLPARAPRGRGRRRPTPSGPPRRSASC